MLSRTLIVVPRLTVLVGVIDIVYDAAATDGIVDIATATIIMMNGVIDRSLIPSLCYYRISNIWTERGSGKHCVTR